MKYMLVIYGSEQAWNSLTEETVARIGHTHKSLQNELAASGELVDHKELDMETAKVAVANVFCGQSDYDAQFELGLDLMLRGMRS